MVVIAVIGEVGQKIKILNYYFNQVFKSLFTKGGLLNTFFSSINYYIYFKNLITVQTQLCLCLKTTIYKNLGEFVQSDFVLL